MQRRLVLASSSPRRRDLLSDAGVVFESVRPEVEEIACDFLSMREHTLCNAARKVRAVAHRQPHAIVLAADTLVALNGRTIGKPVDLDDARRILRRLSGNVHQVCTGVQICCFAARNWSSFAVISHVEFHRLTDAEIDVYLREIGPLDKAGAYAAQGNGRRIIRRIEGSVSNVVGLPMSRTLAALKEFGIKPGAG